jgi:large subunit ribosomal protein L9
MEVILFDDVKDLGRQGDVVKVAPGYFRNFLSPKGLAAEATPANRHRFEKMKKKQQELAAARLADAQALAKKIEGITVTVKAKAGETERLASTLPSPKPRASIRSASRNHAACARGPTSLDVDTSTTDRTRSG